MLFQGRVGFYKTFRGNLSVVTSAADLLKAGVKFVPACQRALENIENVLVASPV